MTALNLAIEWLKYSQNDLISARHLYEDFYPKQTEVVYKKDVFCFLCK